MKIIDAIIVTYYPEIEVFEQTVRTIEKQVREIIIIDNTPNENILNYFEKYDNIKVISFNDNKGIGYAQNVGIKFSIENKAEYVLLSDQDTSYPSNYIFEMLSTFQKYENVAATGPLFKDLNQKKENEGFVKKNKFNFNKIYPKNGKHELRHIIASGKIINLKCLNNIGFFNEDLFIDWVDLEWCWRANYLGYKIIGNADVLIWHNLGDKAIDIKIREVSLRNYTRHYYITRNAFYLSIRCKYINIVLRFKLFFKSFRYILGFTILSEEHFKNLKYTTLGLIHGLSGKQGSLSLHKKKNYGFMRRKRNE